MNLALIEWKTGKITDEEVTEIVKARVDEDPSWKSLAVMLLAGRGHLKQTSEGINEMLATHSTLRQTKFKFPNYLLYQGLLDIK
jgi:hypothetical protein